VRVAVDQSLVDCEARVAVDQSRGSDCEVVADDQFRQRDCEDVAEDRSSVGKIARTWPLISFRHGDCEDVGRRPALNAARLEGESSGQTASHAQGPTMA
jgi:hypothetical protein